jgi:hypothetical protein
VGVCLCAPMLSQAFQLRSPPGISQVRCIGSIAASPAISSLFDPRKRPCSTALAMRYSGIRQNCRGCGLVMTAKGHESRSDIMRTAGLQLHKFAGLAWLLLFEAVVGIVLKSLGIALPPSVSAWPAHIRPTELY